MLATICARWGQPKLPGFAPSPGQSSPTWVYPRPSGKCNLRVFGILSWLRFLHRKRSDAELQDEIEAFLMEEAAENEARGMSPEDARRQARLKFGNAQKVRELLWMQNTLQRLTTIARDVRYAFRMLSRTPGFSIIAIVVMALCLDAATSLFTFVRSVLLRPLPFRDPARLVMVYEPFRGGN